MQLKGKKVLVTGADGFIGSHLVEQLLKEGCSITAFVFYNSFNSWGWLDSFTPETLKKIKVISGDIRDYNAVKNAVKDMDVVFHLAALIAIPYSYSAPESYVDTNIRGTLNILQAVKEKKVSKLIITSTSEVYGTASYVPIDEKHPKQGQSPYSATKIGADSLAESFYRSFDIPVTIARPFNTFGPRQSARAVIPSIITQLISGKKEIKLGALSPTRDLLFINDTVNGFVAIAKSDKTIGEEINIATECEISIGNLAKKIINIINPSAKVISDTQRIRPGKSEVERLLGANTKIKKLTDWKPQYDLDQGLQVTINWFANSENQKKYKADIYSV